MAQIKVGDRIYIVIKGISHLRTITYIGGDVFEWNYGWADINQITENQNKKSKVKFILNV
jgi:hypothetical protein